MFTRHMFLAKNNSLIAAGFISLISQLVLFREFLNVFDGNELLIGLLLFLWMTFTAIGSFAGIRLVRFRNAENLIGCLLLITGIFPVIAVASLYYLKSVFILPGISGGFTTAVFFASILLFPVCLVNGMLFTMLSLFNPVISGKNQTAIAYGYDSLGSVIAGILFTIVLSYMLSVMQLLIVLTSATLMFYTLVFSATLYKKLIFGLFGVIVLATGFSGYPDKLLRSLQFPGQEILYSKDTPYGNLCITGSAGQLNVFQNGILFYSTNNDAVYEESVHFALLQHPDPADVLVVSGGVNGALKQLKKYNKVRQFDYAETNPWLINTETALMPVTDKSLLHILNTDARNHIRQSNNKYDAIILSLPEPVNAQINRYYTLEFFKEARKAMKPGGIIETSLAATPNYVSEEAAALNASVFQTMKLVFRHVKLVVSQKNYYLASDNSISLAYDSLLAIRPVVNDYVNPFYFDDELTVQRSKMVVENLDSGQTSINRDVHPVTYLFQIREWLTKSGIHQEVKIILLVLSVLTGAAFFVLIRNLTDSSFTVFSAAFAGASAEFLLLIIFQILFGQIYRMIGLLFAFYMAGLSAGTFIAARARSRDSRKSVLRFQVILLALVLSFPLLIYFEPATGLSRLVVMSAIMFYTVLIAFAAGYLFGKSVESPSTPLRVTNRYYGIDLMASATGTLLTSVLLFPVAGIWITAGFSSVFLMASFIFNLRK
jgi:spermidine synthase